MPPWPERQACECRCCHQPSVHALTSVSRFHCFHFVGRYIELLISSMAKKTMS